MSETVQFCGQAVTSVRAMTEGGRRVLLVAAKTTPLMIRDAMTGQLLLSTAINTVAYFNGIQSCGQGLGFN